MLFPLDLNQPAETLGQTAQIMGNKILHGLENNHFHFMI